MNNKVNYTFIGILVLFGIALVLGFIYWMLKPQNDSEMKKYTIYFKESVLGLNLDAPIKYRGISVGKVVKMQISPTNTEQVRVIVSVASTIPIKDNTVAKLTAQGITGLTYINLSMDQATGKELTVQKGEKYPIIRSVPSFFDNIEKSLGSVSSKLSSTLGGTQKLLGKDNQKQMALLLKKSASVMEKMDTVLDNRSIEHFYATLKNIDSASRKLDALIPDVDRLIFESIKFEDNISTSLNSIQTNYKSISIAMEKFGKTMDSFGGALSSGQFNIKELTADVVPTVNNTLLELQRLLIQMDNTLEEYEKSPSDILYKRQEIQKAPGER